MKVVNRKLLAPPPSIPWHGIWLFWFFFSISLFVLLSHFHRERGSLRVHPYTKRMGMLMEQCLCCHSYPTTNTLPPFLPHLVTQSLPPSLPPSRRHLLMSVQIEKWEDSAELELHEQAFVNNGNTILNWIKWRHFVLPLNIHSGLHYRITMLTMIEAQQMFKQRVT